MSIDYLTIYIAIRKFLYFIGTITVSSKLDYETAPRYYILVKAVDGGTPPLSTEVGVNITVSDANDNSPLFSQQSYSTVIREDALVGDKIIQVLLVHEKCPNYAPVMWWSVLTHYYCFQVIATDSDSPPNARLRYTVCGGDRYGQFLIDKDMGYISLASDLDREKVIIYFFLLKNYSVIYLSV